MALDLDLVSKMVLACLAEDAREKDRRAMPGLPELQRWTGRGSTVVMTSIRRLQDVELIAQLEYGRLGHRAVYLVLPHGCRAGCHPEIAFDRPEPKATGRPKASTPKDTKMLSVTRKVAFGQPLQNDELLSAQTESPPELLPPELPTSGDVGASEVAESLTRAREHGNFDFEQTGS